MITTLIIDDEAHNRETLRILLTGHCPGIQIVDEAINAEDGFLKVKKHQPQLVFLDVKMPDKSGFALLKLFRRSISRWSSFRPMTVMPSGPLNLTPLVIF